MGQLCTRFILVALCYAVVVPLFTWCAPSQDMDSGRGAKGSIATKDQLASYVQNGKRLVVDGYRIQGADLIAFIKEQPHVAIEITAAVIEGGSISVPYERHRWQK